jgi:hypothetical protein
MPYSLYLRKGMKLFPYYVCCLLKIHPEVNNCSPPASFRNFIAIFVLLKDKMKMKNSKIEQSKKIVREMVELYCRRHLKTDTIPEEYSHLIDYACRRLDHCRFGETKGACKNCPVHCYAPKEREAISRVMRWAGPRMLFYSPKAAILHLFGK